MEVPALPMWPSLLLYGGLFVAFGFASGTLIWAGLAVRRAWLRGASGRPDPREPEAEASMMHVPESGEDVTNSSWVAPATHAARRRQRQAGLVNFPR